MTISKKSHKEWSKDNWYRSDAEQPTPEQLQFGCLQRIAEALEAMAKPYVRLLEDQKWYSERNERQEAQIKRLKNRAAGLKAANTKLKNKHKKESSLDHLPTCGTSYRGCDPKCPKELREQEERIDEGNDDM